MSPDPSSPTEVVRSYFAAFDQRDPDLIAAHVAPDFVNEHTAALGAGCIGAAAYRERLPRFLDSMQELHYEIESLVAQGPSVAVFYSMRGSWHGAAPFEIRGAQHLEVDGGRITHRTDYWDSAVFLAMVDPAARAALRDLGIG